MSEMRVLDTKRGKPLSSFLNVPTNTGSEETSELVDLLTRVAFNLSPSTMIQQTGFTTVGKTGTLEEQLYNARAACKLQIASVAMHLDQDWRSRFFAQLDNLLDFDEWDDKDLPVTDTSFKTLLRLLLLIRAKRRPGLGATSDGHIIAAWTAGANRLTIECLPEDQIRWIVIYHIDGERESAAGQTSIERVAEVLSPYQSKQWFSR